MKKIFQFKQIIISVIPGERSPELWLTNPWLIDRRVFNMYHSKGYDALPTTKEEADAKGQKMNGLMSSFSSIRYYPEGIVAVDLMATRYFLRQAVEDIAKEFGDDVAEEASVDMANVSVVVLTTRNGEPVIVGQVKGNVLGKGEIHAALAAGNINSKYLSEPDPLLATLSAVTPKKIGLDLNCLKPSSFCFMVLGERNTGQVNVGAVARVADFEKVEKAFLESVKDKPFDKLPVNGLAIIPIRDASSIREEIETLELDPPEEGGKWTWKKRTRILRPYTQSFVEELSSTEFQAFLMEKAGL